MINYNDTIDLNRNVSLEELGRFTAINDRMAKVTNMYALRFMRDNGIDVTAHLEELKSLDDDYKTYTRAGECDNMLVYEKRLAVVNKIMELEKIIRSLR